MQIRILQHPSCFKLAHFQSFSKQARFTRENCCLFQGRTKQMGAPASTSGSNTKAKNTEHEQTTKKPRSSSALINLVNQTRDSRQRVSFPVWEKERDLYSTFWCSVGFRNELEGIPLKKTMGLVLRVIPSFPVEPASQLWSFFNYRTGHQPWRHAMCNGSNTRDPTSVVVCDGQSDHHLVRMCVTKGLTTPRVAQKTCARMAVAPKHVVPTWHLGKWNQRLKPA